MVSSDGKRTVLQLFRWQTRQDMCHISRNIEFGGERNLFIAIATNGYFPASDVEVNETVEVSSAGWNDKNRYVKRRTGPKWNQPTGQCRRRRMASPKLLSGFEYFLSSDEAPPYLLPLYFRTRKEQTT